MQLSARHHFYLFLFVFSTCLFEKKAWRKARKDWRSCQACHSGFQFVLPHTCAVIMTLLSQISRTLSTVNSPAASGGVQLVRRSLTTSSKMASSGHRIERDTFGKNQGGRKHSNARGSLAKKSSTTYVLFMYVVSVSDTWRFFWPESAPFQSPRQALFCIRVRTSADVSTD